MAVFYHMNGGGPNGLQADIAREIATLTPENDGAVGVSFNTPRRGLEPSKSAPRYMGPWIARFEPNSAFIGSNFGNEPIFVMDYGGGFMDPIGYRIGSPAFRPGPRFVRYPGERGAPSVIWPEHEIAPGVYVYGIP